MGVLDFLRRDKDEEQSKERRRLLEEEVRQAFRQACWDLYVSNLPEPRVVDAEDKKAKKRGMVSEEALQVPFGIDPRSWTVHFNTSQVPQSLEMVGEQVQYARSVFQHECMHFTQVPSDLVTDAILVDAALKGFRDEKIVKNKEAASAYAHIVQNIFGDLVGDTLLARERYGREDFRELTVWRQREGVRHAVAEGQKAGQQPSLLWQALVRAYEQLWNEDLGMKQYVPRVDARSEKAAADLVSILGGDWKDRRSWEDKVQRFAGVLEPLIQKDAESSQGGQGGGQGRGGVGVPRDVVVQMGEDPRESRIGAGGGKEGEKEKRGRGYARQAGNDRKGLEEGEGSAGGVENTVAQVVLERNRNSPGKFAGTMGALTKMEPDDALRLMYRARARELLIQIEERRNVRAEREPGYQEVWNIGDPVTGRGGLEVVASMLGSGRPVPGVTTYKRRLREASGVGRLKAVPDLFIVIDSSASMNWEPWKDAEGQRGSFDKAVLGAEGASLYALDHGGRVAVVNFSGLRNVTVQEFTRDVDAVERGIMVHYNGGTVVPVRDVARVIQSTRNPLLTCVMSDCQLSNPGEAVGAFSSGVSDLDELAIFYIGPSGQNEFVDPLRQRGALVYPVRGVDDLVGTLIGKVKGEYDAALGEDEE